jgi:hypothetical protein
MYTGIAKGGPMDGQNIGHRSDVLYVNVRPPMPMGVSDLPTAESITFEVGAYTHNNGEWTWKL